MRGKIIYLVICSFLLLNITITNVNAESEDFKGVWIGSVYNSDWPSSSSKGNITKQKEEFINMLEELEEIGINNIFIQVRPKGDALYNSSINPWSDVLTGTQGKYPGYDPLKFIIEQAHSRGIKVHAWINPYRVTTSGTDLSKLTDNHPAKQNPDWVISYNNALYYNPEVDEVKQHILDTVDEIIKNYDVDGIHMDDYFYPRNYPLPTGESRDGKIANERRNHVNDTISKISKLIKNYDSKIEFGISPSGIWKNKSSDITGSDTRGSESYYSDYADVRTWIKNKWIDYVVPQLYWEIGYSIADYSKLLPWWNNEVKNSGVSLYIGQGIYKDVVAGEIDAQLRLNEKYSEVKGSVFFSASDILNNRSGCKDKIKKIYIENNTYYLDINSFIGEDSVKLALEKLQSETGWYAQYQRMNQKEELYNIETGGFVGIDNATNAVSQLKLSTGLDASTKFSGTYTKGSCTPIYRIETGGFYGEENAKIALEWLKKETGWWATLEPNGSIHNEYKIVTGGFAGEESVKVALNTLTQKSGWWADYVFNGDYIETQGTPIYNLYIDSIIGENNAINTLEKIKSVTGWYAQYKFSGNYMYYYKIITGGFVGLDNAKKQSQYITDIYNWYNEVKKQ